MVVHINPPGPFWPKELVPAIWTGNRMVVWGGDAYSYWANDGGRYDPVTDRWMPTSTVGAPTRQRQPHRFIWTGHLMIIWGGLNGLASGGRVRPRGRFLDGDIPYWSAGRTREPCGRVDRHADGGLGEGCPLGSRFWVLYNTGGRYDPVADRWTPTTTSGAPPSRTFVISTWTGQHLPKVWGAVENSDHNGWIPMNTGRRYNPVSTHGQQ